MSNANDVYLAGALENSRNSERLVNTGKKIADVGSDIAKMKMILNAMWEIMQEQGVDAGVLNNKIDGILARERKKTSYGNPRKPCPNCGRTIQESSSTPMRGRCVFCGEEVVFYPFADYDAEEGTGSGVTGSDTE